MLVDLARRLEATACACALGHRGKLGLVAAPTAASCVAVDTDAVLLAGSTRASACASGPSAAATRLALRAGARVRTVREPRRPSPTAHRTDGGARRRARHRRDHRHCAAHHRLTTTNAPSRARGTADVSPDAAARRQRQPEPGPPSRPAREDENDERCGGRSRRTTDLSAAWDPERLASRSRISASSCAWWGGLFLGDALLRGLTLAQLCSPASLSRSRRSLPRR